jgi:ATP-dependent RNA helicase RhlE
LIDLERQGILNLSKYNAIVLDEVDTMVDMGFINDIKYIIRKLPQKRLSLFFSATIPVALKEVMSQFLKNPAVISVKTRQSAENVNQSVIKVGSQDKIELLHDLLIKPEFTRVIIFLRTRWAVNKLARQLQDRGFEVASIHGDKTQSQRSKALSAFKAGRVRILLATDVVARGIDIDNVSHVINYDMPESHEDYIHRIGRTGRADKVGQAITFVD